MPENKQKPILAISIGDINGIGPEIIIKAFSDDRLFKYVTPVVYGSSKVLSYYNRGLNLQQDIFQLKPGHKPNPKKLNVLNVWSDDVELKPGEANSDGGKYAFLSLEAAVIAVQRGEAHGLVTAPINKHLLADQGFAFPGHTEYLTEASSKKESLMLLITQELRVGVVTGHVPLLDVPKHITKERLQSKLDIFHQSLRKDFGIKKPRLAVMGVNPHAGEDGLLGNEEKQILLPVLEELRNEGKLLFGPFPADGFFGTHQYKSYDGILAMYHDQGLIPFKTLAFEEGVNYTAGLDFVRTSPDHGTAYAIAGKNEASPTSLRQAVYAAIDIIRHRL